MKHRTLSAIACLALCAGLVAQPPTTKPAPKPVPAEKPAAQPTGQPAGQPSAPPGMTEADMKACMDAAMPGPQHAELAKNAGTWAGKCKMWMAPGTEPQSSECTTTITAIMDGRYFRNETKGDMPGMGPFTGFGIAGFDNVAHKYQGTWIDNCGTGMMTGTGELSSDGKTMTWSYTYNCPIAKKAVTMRQVEKHTGPNSMTLEMFTPDPHTGKEFKAMEISYTRTAGAPSANAEPTR